MSAPVVTQLHSSDALQVVEYRCQQELHEPSFTEVHDAYTLAIVRKGSFGYCTEGRRHELVAGSVMLGRTGREYVCTHDHASGDVCLSFCFAPALLEELAGSKFVEVWNRCALPPVEELMVLGASSNQALDELGLELAARVIELVGGRALDSGKEPTPVDRRRAVRVAELIETRYTEQLDLETLAAEAGLSSFHFLRTFSRVIGATPHQYLLRTRLAAAARLLLEDSRPVTNVALEVGFNDLSSFVRTFRRAAGSAPGAFRSKILQERSAHDC